MQPTAAADTATSATAVSWCFKYTSCTLRQQQQPLQHLSAPLFPQLPLQESDARVNRVFGEFIKELKQQVEPEINRRNTDPANISRSRAANGLPYTLLIPSSGPGVTMQGVPYSISI
jgi:hypothetical protein